MGEHTLCHLRVDRISYCHELVYMAPPWAVGVRLVCIIVIYLTISHNYVAAKRLEDTRPEGMLPSWPHWGQDTVHRSAKTGVKYGHQRL